MENWQGYIIGVLGVLAAVFFVAGVLHVGKGKTYQKFWPLNLIGAFVWGDALVFGPFWIIASIIVLTQQDWWLFEIIFLSFWLVRSFGETVYWLNQQFSPIKREPPEKIWFYRFIKSDAVWFIFQIWWQCLSVVSLVLLILLIK